MLRVTGSHNLSMMHVSGNNLLMLRVSGNNLLMLRVSGNNLLMLRVSGSKPSSGSTSAACTKAFGQKDEADPNEGCGLR